MLDKRGYRPNVGMILLNRRNQVWWGRRARRDSWQFPQGGLKEGETLVAGMFRELNEEVGLLPTHVKVLGRTRDWVYYDVPEMLRRSHQLLNHHHHFRGQKQIWFFLRFLGLNLDVRVNDGERPEFDAWTWSDFWHPLDSVVAFKRPVYVQVMQELSQQLQVPGPGVEESNPFFLKIF